MRTTILFMEESFANSGLVASFQTELESCRADLTAKNGQISDNEVRFYTNLLMQLTSIPTAESMFIPDDTL